jgi:uncharacterized protein (TIGR03437 family)
VQCFWVIGYIPLGVALIVDSGVEGLGALLSNVSVQIGNVTGTVTFAGRDQVNFIVPASLKGRGRLTTMLKVDGQTANPVQLSF